MSVNFDSRVDVIRSSYEKDIASYWDSKQDDKINLLPGQIDDLYHHHYGVGAFDPGILVGPAETREHRIVEEMHRLESQQVEVIISALGDVSPHDPVLDAGSGRGGTSFMIGERFGCRVDGVNISEYQIEFSRQLAIKRGCADQVKFHYRNMRSTGFPDQSFQRVVSNETTMYVDLFDAFGEFARLLSPGGRYVVITWCYNDIVSPPRHEIEEIDRFYNCHIHPRSTYFSALAANGLIPCQVTDLTADAIPYWELRRHSEFRNGIEQAFLSAYQQGFMNFLLIVADRLVP
ncbi:MAG: SAM-dependent methyltransferase [Pseudonocardiaceae bacterium]